MFVLYIVFVVKIVQYTFVFTANTTIYATHCILREAKRGNSHGTIREDGDFFWIWGTPRFGILNVPKCETFGISDHAQNVDEFVMMLLKYPLEQSNVAVSEVTKDLNPSGLNLIAIFSLQNLQRQSNPNPTYYPSSQISRAAICRRGGLVYGNFLNSGFLTSLRCQEGTTKVTEVSKLKIFKYLLNKYSEVFSTRKGNKKQSRLLTLTSSVSVVFLHLHTIQLDTGILVILGSGNEIQIVRLYSPAELLPDVRPVVGVGEPVGGLGGGDLGLSVLLPGVTVSKAEPCDGAGKVYADGLCGREIWKGSLIED
ncbi:hypothetical protein WN51_05119 [Melipona quadrifasciata]|uniref:Uncharacterized protein n=1 Tax=Melipona quadrifasciata TaxID=166423 RepID=A0A0M8ZRD7_9HYME|nr:hypothetical protein WN51_05119 [Melipona quadrifasciata]